MTSNLPIFLALNYGESGFAVCLNSFVALWIAGIVKRQAKELKSATDFISNFRAVLGDFSCEDGPETQVVLAGRLGETRFGLMR